jgi:DNA-binding NarL/FixJ family response regulator
MNISSNAMRARREHCSPDGADRTVNDVHDRIGDVATEESQHTADGQCVQSVALIDERALIRDSLQIALAAQSPSWHVVTYGTVEEWRARENDPAHLVAVLYYLGSRKATDPDTAGHLKRLVCDAGPLPVVVIGDADDAVEVVNALGCGACGYIPSSVNAEICVAATNLAIAGGMFVPVSSVSGMRRTMASNPAQKSCLEELLTPRQIKVAEAVCKGKPNKIIAYELGMCESTVKVHVRSIMEKVKATNRTQVANKISGMISRHAPHGPRQSMQFLPDRPGPDREDHGGSP